MITPSGSVVPTELPRPRNAKKGGQAGAFAWPERFFVREVIPPSWENTPFIKAMLRAREDPSELEDPDDEDLIHSLKTEENWVPDRYRIESFLDIFHGATLRQLQNGEDTVSTDAVALLIDGNNIGGQPRFRQLLGVLSARRLLEELTKKRYSEDMDVTGDEFIEAERRLIYIDTLDAWSILAIMGTAPESLHRPLTEFILDYIRSKCRIGVSFATEGPETFTLQFSLPVRALRPTDTPKTDPRIKASDQERLRPSTDITFLRDLGDTKPESATYDIIYSSHLSFMVTGYDQFRWTGVGVAETWFEDKVDDPSPDTMPRYENDYQDSEFQWIPDPLCRGRVDTMKSFWSPRPYFVHILGVRLNQIYTEWEAVHTHFHKKIKAASKHHKSLLSRMQGPPCAQTSGVRIVDQRDVQRFEHGVHEAEELLRGLVNDLEETLRSGKRFMETDVNYFLHLDGQPGDAADCLPHLSHIRQIFHEMDQQSKRLSDLRGECKQMLKNGANAKQDYVLQMQMNKIFHASSQPAVPPQSLEIRIMSCTAIISTPLLITAAVFSCDGIIPFPRTWYYFLCAVMAMTGLMSLAVVIWIRVSGQGVISLRRQAPEPTAAEGCSLDVTEPRYAASIDSNTGPPPRRPTVGTRLMQTFQRNGGNQVLLGQTELLGNPAAVELDILKPPPAAILTRKLCAESFPS